MSAPTIRTEGLRKTYVMGRHLVHALDGVDLALDSNAFAAVIGPSGSGKSTLLHLLGGLDRPTGGSIHVDGQVLEQLDEHGLADYRLHRVGFIFQSFNLIASMTALENVAFPLVFRRVPHRQRRDVAHDLLSQVGLSSHADHRPGELSGGQQQRVAVARALANSPDVILADEPTGNLDTQSGAVIMELLAQLHQQGKTVLVVSHDPRITRYATMTIRLLDGRVVDQKTYEAALEEPAGRPRRPKRKPS
jgi:putative ABC transport system ATP-binding protein